MRVISLRVRAALHTAARGGSIAALATVVSIAQLRKQYLALCQQLGAQGRFQTVAQHDGSAHVEVTADSYQYVVTERGTEFERKRTHDADRLLYWLMSDVVFSVASQYELTHRIEGQDFRRLLFQKEIELMGQLSADWSERKRQEIERILSDHPYDDLACG
jgi:hypothetical protein